MATDSVRLSYHSAGPLRDESLLPFLPIELSYGSSTLTANALLDSRASVNVLPYSIGLQLGADWEAAGQELALGGNLASAPVKGMLLQAVVAHYQPIRLVFAWSRLDSMPVILGQMNFFQSLNICFFGADHTFEIQPHIQ